MAGARALVLSEIGDEFGGRLKMFQDGVSETFFETR